MCYKAGLLLFLHFGTQLELTSGESGLAQLEQLVATTETTAESTSNPVQQNYPDHPEDKIQGEQGAAIPKLKFRKQQFRKRPVQARLEQLVTTIETTAESTSSPVQQNNPDEDYDEDEISGEVNRQRGKTKNNSGKKIRGQKKGLKARTGNRNPETEGSINEGDQNYYYYYEPEDDQYKTQTEQVVSNEPEDEQDTAPKELQVVSVQDLKHLIEELKSLKKNYQQHQQYPQHPTPSVAPHPPPPPPTPSVAPHPPPPPPTQPSTTTTTTTTTTTVPVCKRIPSRGKDMVQCHDGTYCKLEYKKKRTGHIFLHNYKECCIKHAYMGTGYKGCPDDQPDLCDHLKCW